MEYALQALRKYAVFSGRSRRKEYWFFILFSILGSIVAGIVDGVLGTVDEATGIGIAGCLFMLALLVPSIAVGVRRLHDIGKSGWWLLIGLIPLVGAIVLIVFAVQDSQPGTNQYGPNPKEAADAGTVQPPPVPQ
jgi:uncharacterized membrane protein YhaH (DUF805 family)